MAMRNTINGVGETGNRVKNSQGVQWLSVPILTKGKRSQLINQARIDPASKWGSKHLTSLETNYKKTIYFDHFYCQIEPLFNKKWNYLLDLNLNLLNLLKEYLGIKTQIILSSSLLKRLPQDASPESRLIKICEKLGGNSLYEGAAGKNYIDANIFEGAHINLIYQQYCHPVYNQLFGSFIPNLSVVDLIFNEGPNALPVLELKR